MHIFIFVISFILMINLLYNIMKKNLFCLSLAFAFLSFDSFAGVDLKVSGNSDSGFYVDILKDGRIISDNSLSGELSLYVDNEDYSVRENLDNWRADIVNDYGDSIVLSGDVFLKRLEVNLNINVIYKKIGNELVEKRIELEQNNIPLLFYSIGTEISPGSSQAKFWSFDDNNNNGGIVHETFPAAGYMLDDNLAVGFLTDAGNRNKWTRNIRRRPSKQGEIGFRAIKEICDAGLIRISDIKERTSGHPFVKYTFGEVSDFNHPKSLYCYDMPSIKQWKSYNGAECRKKGNVYEIFGKRCCTGMSGMKIPFKLKDGFYTIRFKHKSVYPYSLRFWKGEGTDNIDVVGLHYQTDIKSSSDEWIEDEETVFISNMEDETAYLLIASSSIPQMSDFKLEIKDFKIIRSDASEYAYHRLEQGKKEVKRLFVFATEADNTLHDLRLASQVYLADALGFKGSVEEKCIYSCYQMLVWITSRYNFAPLNVPSINYAPDMYNRDSFWSVMGVYDKETSESIFNQWAATQDSRGAIGTIITPCMGSTEVKGNEATLEFLWFALVNKRLYGTHLPMDKLKKAFDFCLEEFDSDGDGKCSSEFVLGQNDVVEYPDKTSGLAVNQGMFAVTLQVAAELGFPVSHEYIEKANQYYREFYDSEKGYIIDNRMYPYSITFNSLLPEFVSLWLFDKPILTSEMVINTLDKIPYKNGYSPIISHVNNVYFTIEDKPFSPGMFWDNGIYYNAGSWMREEICGYVAGLKHGWKDAERRIKERMHVEISLNPDEPFSHEFLPFDLSVKGCWWPSTRVFSWNVFVLRALEVAGMRNPAQDPDYEKNVR